MIVFEITNRKDGIKKQFKVEQSIEEVTLKRFVGFKETVDYAKPKSLSDYELADGEEERKKILDALDANEIFNNWNDYFIEFIKYWLTMPDEWSSELTVEEIKFLYNTVNSMLGSFEYSHKNSFRFKKETYFYPNAIENPITNQVEYMKGSRVIDAIEAFQFEMYSAQLGKSNWKVMPNIFAVLCKKQDEQLPLLSLVRDKWIAERTKMFEELPLSEALNIAFFLLIRKNISRNDLSHSLTPGQQGSLSATEQKESGRNTDGTQALNG